jgi:four helix bundle protein
VNADFGLRISDCKLWISDRIADAMTPAESRQRTKAFALGVIALVDSLPRTRVADVIGRQLLRCSPSVGANYRAACRARSTAEFLAKLGIVEEEADESLYWLELLVDSRTARSEQVSELLQQADELLALTVSSIKTTREGSRTLSDRSAIRNPQSAIGGGKSR